MGQADTDHYRELPTRSLAGRLHELAGQLVMNESRALTTAAADRLMNLDRIVRRPLGALWEEAERLARDDWFGTKHRQRQADLERFGPCEFCGAPRTVSIMEDPTLRTRAFRLHCPVCGKDAT